MSYREMYEIANILDEKTRLKKFIAHYSKMEIKGLHYVDFNNKNGIVHISTPKHMIHDEATLFLLKMKHESGRINTVSSNAHNLKKFLDFLLIWEIDLLKADLLILMTSFVSYLRVIEKFRPNANSLEWSLLKKVPLHQRAISLNKITKIGYDEDGFMSKESFEDYDYETISKFVKTALDYLDFLQNFTVTYRDLNLHELPVRMVKNNSLLTGTTGKKSENVTYNIKVLLQESGIDTKMVSTERIKPISEEVFSVEEMETFMKAIPDNDAQTKLLFSVLKNFGLRRAEACNLMIDSRKIPNQFYLWDINDAKKWVKEELKGDIEFDKRLDKWVCAVVRRNTTNFQAQHKSKSRNIPLLFPQDEFTSLIVEHLFERQLTMETCEHSHDFLFYSNSNNSKGKRISGGTIYSKYNDVVKQMDDSQLFEKFSPHTFRHFFATYLIRVKRENIFFVSSWLGHSNENITKKVYLHYLPSDKEDEREGSVLDDMISTFSLNDEVNNDGGNHEEEFSK